MHQHEHAARSGSKQEAGEDTRQATQLSALDVITLPVLYLEKLVFVKCNE